MQQSNPFDVNHMSWDDVRLFLVCARKRSFRAAAAELNVTSSTVVRRMERFEQSLGLHVFDRLPSGISLTREGQQVMKAAEQFEAGAIELQRSVDALDSNNRGKVRISIMDGLGTFWVMPRLVEFQRANPLLQIDLQCAGECADVLRLEADIAVQFTKPENPDLMCTRLGALHLYPFASQKYLSLFGIPEKREDMLAHRLVDQAAPQLDKGAWPALLGIESTEDIVGIRTNSSAAHFYAIEKGAGIGGLPTYAKALGATVEPIDIGLRHSLEIWMTFHPSARKVPRIATVIEWVRGCFDGRRFPWFRDEFIHPNKLGDLGPDNWRENLAEDTVVARGL